MGGIKSCITINIFYRTNKITPNIILLKYNKNKGRKKKEGRNIREEKNERKKKVSHPVSNQRPNSREACVLPIALHKTLQQALRNFCYM